MKKLVLALCTCLMVCITGCAANKDSELFQKRVAERAEEGRANSDEETEKAMEILKQYGNRSEAKRAFMKQLRQECPGFTPASEQAKYAECQKRYRAFLAELNNM